MKFFLCVPATRAASVDTGGRTDGTVTDTYLVKALRESNSEDADEAETDETGGCSAENLFKLVALGRKESGRAERQDRRATTRSVAADTFASQSH